MASVWSGIIDESLWHGKLSEQLTFDHYRQVASLKSAEQQSSFLK
jgi:hypothetical protein